MGCRLSVQRIPTELVIRILLSLSLDDIQSASYVSRRLRDTVKGSSLLQRHALLEELDYVECKVDACKNMLLSDKVAALQRHRRMWHSCQFLLSKSRSSVLHKEIKFTVYDCDRRFTQGLYILHQTEATERDSRAIHIFQVTKPCDCNARIKELDVHQENCLRITKVGTTRCSLPIRGYAVERYGQDLLVMVTMECKVNGESIGLSVNLHLRRLCDFEVHPRAERPDCTLADIEFSPDGVFDYAILSRVRAKVEIAGENVLVLLHWGHTGFEDIEASYSRLIWVDWINGTILAHDATFNGAWKSFAFLTQDIILLTNCHSETIDIIRLPTSSDAIVISEEGRSATFTMLLRLRLPDRQCPFWPSILGFDFSGRPDPISDSLGQYQDHAGHLPFGSNPDNSVILVTLTIDDGSIAHDSLACDLAIHRSAMLALLSTHSHIVDSATPGPLYSLSRRLCCLYGTRKPPTGPNVAEWDDWGPDVTQWFGQDAPQNSVDRVAHGQRMVWVDVPANELVVCDFNPNSVRRARDALASRGNIAPDDEMTVVNGKTPAMKKFIETRQVWSFDQISMTGEGAIPAGVSASTESRQGSKPSTESVETSGAQRECHSAEFAHKRDALRKDTHSSTIGNGSQEPRQTASRYKSIAPDSDDDHVKLAKSTNGTRTSKGVVSEHEAQPSSITSEPLGKPKVLAKGDDLIAKALKKLTEDRRTRETHELRRQVAKKDLKRCRITRKLVDSNVLVAKQHLAQSIRSGLPYLETRRAIDLDAPFVRLHLDEDYLLVENIERINIDWYDFAGSVDVYPII